MSPLTHHKVDFVAFTVSIATSIIEAQKQDVYDHSALFSVGGLRRMKVQCLTHQLGIIINYVKGVCVCVCGGGAR